LILILTFDVDSGLSLWFLPLVLIPTLDFDFCLWVAQRFTAAITIEF